MPKQNPYFIPKENYKKVEEVREIDSFWEEENHNQGVSSPSSEVKTKKRRKKKKVAERFCTNERCPKQYYNQKDCDDTYINGEGKWHRIFGEWKCNRCRNKWKSGYVWILLGKYEDNTSVSDLETKDYLQQECKKCKNKVNKLTEWHRLLKDKKIEGDVRPHQSALCAKCQAGAMCQDSLGYQHF